MLIASTAVPLQAQNCAYSWVFDADGTPSDWSGSGLIVNGDGQLYQNQRPLAYFYANFSGMGISDLSSDGDSLEVNGRLGSPFATGTESTLTLFAEFSNGMVITTAVTSDIQQSFQSELSFPSGQQLQQIGFYSDLPSTPHLLHVSSIRYQHNDCVGVQPSTAIYNAELFAFLLVVLIFISLEVNHIARLYALLYFHFGYSVLTPDLLQTDGQYQYWLLFFVYLIWRLFRLIPDRFVLED